jgi:hypothetical protein
MKGSLKVIFFSIIIVVIGRQFLIKPLIQLKLEKVIESEIFHDEKFKHDCISNRRHDGSETLISTYSESELVEALNTIIFLAKLYVGPESRIYIYVQKNTNQEISAELVTSKMWRSSTFYFGDLALATNE